MICPCCFNLFFSGGRNITVTGTGFDLIQSFSLVVTAEFPEERKKTLNQNSKEVSFLFLSNVLSIRCLNMNWLGLGFRENFKFRFIPTDNSRWRARLCMQQSKALPSPFLAIRWQATWMCVAELTSEWWNEISWEIQKEIIYLLPCPPYRVLRDLAKTTQIPITLVLVFVKSKPERVCKTKVPFVLRICHLWCMYVYVCEV